MNNETTHELLEILNAFDNSLNEFLARRGHDETAPEVHAEIQNGGKMYNTAKLVNTFLELERDGYTAVNLKLVIDLINRDCLEGDE